MNHTTSLNDSQQILMQTLHKIDGAYAPATIRAYRADFIEFIEYADMKTRQHCQRQASPCLALLHI